MPTTTISFAATASCTSFRMSAPWVATFSRTAVWISSAGRMLRPIALILVTREKAVELAREALAVRVVDRRGTAGPLPRAAQLVQVVAQRQALLDVLRRIELAARIERVPALGDHVRSERNVGGDDEIARRELAHDVAVRDVDASRHLQGADVRRRRRAQQLVRHQRQRDLRPLRRPVEDILDDRGTRVGVNPDVHGWGQTPILPGSRFTGV